MSDAKIIQFPGGGDSYTSPLSQNRENPTYIDWLSVYQYHPEGCPIFGKDKVLKVELESGEVKSETVTNMRHEGSFETSLAIRSDGAKVCVSGNPSKFNKSHNVTGLYSIQSDCLSLYNQILDSLSIPSFYQTNTKFQRSDGGVYVDRPIITRVDLTRNYEVGEGNVIPFISWLATQKHQRSIGHVYGNCRTVDWNRGSKRVYIKYYDKAFEMTLHKGETDNTKLINYLNSRGILRHEISIKSNQLKPLGLDNPDNWNSEIMTDLSDKYSFHKRVSGTRNSLLDIRDDLISLDINANLARRCQDAALAWASGVRYVPGENISKSAYYRLRAPLLLLGIDIGIPANVTTLPIKVREIEVRPFILPAEFEAM